VPHRHDREGWSFVMKKFVAYLLALVFLALGPAAAHAQSRIAPPAPVASTAGPAYRVNPGDDLEIMVWGDERLQRTVRVLPDGTFSFPLVGQVMAAGLLPSDLARIITAGLKPQYRDVVPQVTVSVKNPNGYQFSVIGKVKGPGTFTPGRYVNALEAIGIAGGPTEFAQTSRIRIIRKVGGRVQAIPVRIAAALKGDFSEITELPEIQSGDTLVVP
jgi:polysaccharide biosynthesis/export protein